MHFGIQNLQVSMKNRVERQVSIHYADIQGVYVYSPKTQMF